MKLAIYLLPRLGKSGAIPLRSHTLSCGFNPYPANVENKLSS